LNTIQPFWYKAEHKPRILGDS